MSERPIFDAEFQARLEQLFLWRRDVRRFRTDPVDPALIDKLVELACVAPSVGNSQPWRYVLVEEPARRAAIRADFERCKQDAMIDYEGEQARQYAQLKLSGMDQAPVQLAIFADLATPRGAGLGRRTMPETMAYSVVAAVQLLWLAARAMGLGVGWVSIIEPDSVRTILDVPSEWKLVAYLCIGWPEEEHIDPELERYGWQAREPASSFIVRR